MDQAQYTDEQLESVAIIGMAGRFPGAQSLGRFWQNLCDGVESIRDMDCEHLRQQGVSEADIADPGYIRRASTLDNVAGFDARFFGIAPREAELMDPQHRLLLECAYEAVESAGYNPFSMARDVGVYAGVSLSDYLLTNVSVQPDVMAQADGLQILVGNDKGYAATRIAHKLGLTGPAIGIDTACSTSLVAVHQACRALLGYECEMALAGGAKVAVPHGCGYRHQAGGILSATGQCRPFDASASGTVHGSGVGMVLLKRLTDALDDGDIIHAVIRGTAVNNDGSAKIGYTAPGIQGQADVIAQALAVANVDAETIGYVEAHGTGTSLGDPIEVKALSQVFGKPDGKCALGAVKANIGHLDVAAGVTGLIKVALAVRSGTVPPTLHFTEPNGDIDFSTTPFFINTEQQEWPRDGVRRAGVSSFGIGGTNAHAVVEEPPPVRRHNGPVRSHYLIPISAQTTQALDEYRDQMAGTLGSTNEALRDIAFTMSCGRPHFSARSAVVAASCDDAAVALRDLPVGETRGFVDGSVEQVAYLFSGQGSQYPSMGAELYAQSPVFRKTFDEIAAYCAEYLPVSLSDVVFGPEAKSLLERTQFVQPALFAVEYSLAMLWRDLGVVPRSVAGHSVGEVTAACFAGVFSLRDGVRLICARGKAMSNARTDGAMLAIAHDQGAVEQRIRTYGGQIQIAAINGPQNVVLSGDAEALCELKTELDQADIRNRTLSVDRAFHSYHMDAVLDEFRDAISTVRFSAPEVDLVYDLQLAAECGGVATVDYWVAHIRRPVRFADYINRLVEAGVRVFVETGPHPTLVRMARNAWPNLEAAWLPSLDRNQADWKALLASLSRYFIAGGNPQWERLFDGTNARRTLLPTYPFQREVYWSLPGILPSTPASTAQQEARPSSAENEEALSRDAQRDSTFVEAVRDCWQAVLGVAQVSSHDDFFDLGGHSLLVLQLNKALGQRFGCDLPVNTLVEHPRFDHYCAAIHSLCSGDAVPGELPEIEHDRDSIHDPFPLVDLQQAFLVGRQSDFGLGGVSTHLYFEARPLALDFARFRSAFNRLVQRHDMLRAVVVDDELQRIRPVVDDYPIRLYDLATMDMDLDAHLASLRQIMSHQVLDCHKGPLFDVRVTRAADDEWVIHFSIDLLMLDVRSNQILFRDLEMLYQGQDDQLPALPVSYRDYVLAERDLHSGEAMQRAREYWTNRVPSLPLAPDLPLRCNPDEVQFPEFRRRMVALDREQSRQLRRAAAAVGVTPSVALLTAYALVLGRWSSRPRFCLNLTMFNRLPLHSCVNDLVGDFTTLSLLETDTGGTLSFRQRVKAVQKQLWADAEHRAFGGVQVLRELTRHYGGTQQITMPVVFTSALPLDEGADNPVTEDALLRGLGEGFSISQTPQVWIDHVVSDSDGQIVLSWDAIDDLFEPEMLDAMFDQYVELVFDLASDKKASWDDCRFSLLPEPQARIREVANETSASESTVSLLARFVENADQRPQAAAVIAYGTRLSYGDMYRIASHWAAWLRETGVQRGDVVAVIMRKGWEQPVAAIAIQMAGAAYIPVDADLPEHRQKAIIDRAQVCHALTQDVLDIEGVDLVWAQVQQDVETPSGFVSHTPSPQDLAYVLFTSGSTGTPKGVMIDHRAATNTMLDIIDRFGVTTEERVLAVSSMSFDLSVFDMLGILAAGGSMVIPTPDNVRDPEALYELMDRHQVTLLNTVPALVQTVVDYCEVRARQLPTSLRLVMMGGDFIPVGLPARIRGLHDDVALMSMGGPTETAIYSVWYPIGKVDPAWRSIPYGKPLRNRKCWIMDEDFNEKPDGVCGEILIGGDGFLSTGYWRDPDLTAQKFVRHPVTDEMMFRTGDLGRFRPDGNIEIVGRCDFQVKIHGFRVELGEIEAILLRDPEVARGVAGVTSAGSGKQLAAYVVTAPGADSEGVQERLRSRCEHVLPDYMRPRHYVFLDALPLNANGKIDRGALPAPVAIAESAGRDAPETPTERWLVETWKGLLSRDHVGVDENFFDLGGHSLIAAQLITRVRKHFSCVVSMRALFSHPTIAELAAQIDASSAEPALPTLTKAEAGSQVLSFAQRRLWFIDQLDRETAGYGNAYNMPLAWSIDGPVDSEVMHRTLVEIVKRHPVLRSVIRDSGGEPLTVLVSRCDVPWREVECTHGGQDLIDKVVEEEIAAPFLLDQAPLLRGLLVNVGRNKSILIVNMHHIVTDAWSVGILEREILEVYSALDTGRTLPTASEVQASSLHYSDFAAWQNEVWAQGLMDHHESYWLRQLEHLPGVLELPTDYPAPPKRSYRGTALPFALTDTQTSSLRALAQTTGATPFMILLGVFALLLKRMSGADDLLIGTDTANRSPEQTEHMLGYFINQIALRVSIDESATVREYLSAVRTTVLDGFEHDVMPLDRLIDRLDIDRDLATSPLFQVKMNYHSVADEELSCAPFTVSRLPLELTTVHYDLVLTFKPDGDSLLGTVQYRDDLFARSTMERLIGAFQQVLDEFVQRKDQPLREVQTLDRATSRKMIALGRRLRDCPSEDTIVTRFGDRATDQSDKVALTGGDAHLTYRELDMKSSRVAAHLIANGVCPGDRVALYLRRGPSQVIAILGILKVGAAYVPLDRRSPAERLYDILTDATPSVLLTDRQTLEVAPLNPECVNPECVNPECAMVLLDEVPHDAAEIRLPSFDSSLPAYVIYTSGTTGKPNGVIVTHKHVIRLLDACNSRFRFTCNDVWTLFHSYVFDFSVWEIWGALCNGGRLVCVPYSVSRSGADFADLLRTEKVTVLNQTPSAFRQLTGAVLDATGRDSAADYHLRYVIFGGEALEPSALRPWFEVFGDQKPVLVNMYGITETTVHVTHRALSLSDTFAPASLIGRAIDDLDVYVLDDSLQPVPVGIPGQLYVGGAGLSPGYLQRPGLTASRFVPDPFCGEAGGRLYRTGDLARWTVDGDIDYLGRLDQQVQIRGHRVEPGEIEHTLSAHPLVKESAVIFHEEAGGTLAAYIVASADICERELREWVATRLPAYMVPGHFIPLQRLPLTINGKLDRRALPSPESSAAKLAAPVAPATPTESTVVALVSTLLNRTEVGTNHNFFSLGGHSLLATQLASRLRDALDTEIPLKWLFEVDDLKSLAALLDDNQRSSLAASLLSDTDDSHNEEIVL